MNQRPSHTPTPNSGDAIDRLLDAHLSSTTEELAPSSGFIASVMESIHAEATEPPPIAFPWRRALPGAIAIFCCLLAYIGFAIHEAGAAPRIASPTPQSYGISWPQLTHALAVNPHAITLSLILAACLSIAAVAASFRMAGRSD